MDEEERESMKRLLEFRPTYHGPIVAVDLDRVVSTSVLTLSGLALVALIFIAPPALSAPKDFPRPAALEEDVAFWKRIYSEVGTDAGLIHDSRDLGVVYEVAQIPTGLSYRARERHTEKRKKIYKQILLKLAKGKRSGLSREEKRVLALFPKNVSNSTLKKSASRVRFQLGQANKFRAGVIRSGAYKPHILATLRDMNLPLEIASLPHVESSYTPNVYSRVGAAGLWQFTRSTGRRFMRVDHVVDERLDPYHASIAAARLLEQNRRVTGAWPLAITAYNHGAAGMRRPTCLLTASLAFSTKAFAAAISASAASSGRLCLIAAGPRMCSGSCGGGAKNGMRPLCQSYRTIFAAVFRSGSPPFKRRPVKRATCCRKSSGLSQLCTLYALLRYSGLTLATTSGMCSHASSRSEILTTPLSTASVSESSVS